MICISSFRPFNQCSEDIKQNQLRAFKSWLFAFEEITYFNLPEVGVQSCKTRFVPCSGKPTIRNIAQVASLARSWVAIVNADIVVTEKIIGVEHRLKEQECKCFISRRYDTKTGMILDEGLDIFGAVPEVWRAVALRVPKELTLGRILWDTWMLSYFVANYGRKCADISPAKCIFHPQHAERRDQNIDPIDDKYLKQWYWPVTAIH